MPDLHVVALIYRLQSGDHISYVNPPPMIFENETARFLLENNRLRCEMKMHVVTSEVRLRPEYFLDGLIPMLEVSFLCLG